MLQLKSIYKRCNLLTREIFRLPTVRQLSTYKTIYRNNILNHPSYSYIKSNYWNLSKLFYAAPLLNMEQKDSDANSTQNVPNDDFIEDDRMKTNDDNKNQKTTE